MHLLDIPRGGALSSQGPLAVVRAMLAERRADLTDVAAKKRALDAIDAQIAELQERREELDQVYNTAQMAMDTASDEYERRLGVMARDSRVSQLELLEAIAFLHRGVVRLDEDVVADMVRRVKLLIELPAGTPVVIGNSPLIDPSMWFGAPLAKVTLFHYGQGSDSRWSVRALLKHERGVTPPIFIVSFAHLVDNVLDDLAQRRDIFVGEDRIVAMVARAAVQPEDFPDYAAIRQAVINAGLPEALCEPLAQ